MVIRGACNFTHKTRTQAIRRNAAAVIVINTNPVELFCMAGDRDQDATSSTEGCSQMDLPPSVLISGNDGELLMGIFGDEDLDPSTIEATVNISKQSDDQITAFPYVKGSDNTLQILASNGWGTHAVKQADATAANKGWQLFITSHDTSAT